MAIVIGIIIVVALFAFAHWQPSKLVAAILALVSRVWGFRRETLRAAGLSWPYYSKGSIQSGVPVLLVHGYAADKDSWLGYARLLAKSFTVVMPDLPGFGQSARSAQMDYSPRDQAKRLAAFCKEAGISRCHVVGSSMGGYISAWLAIDFPELVQSLTLMNAAGVVGEKASVVQNDAEQGINPLLANSLEDLDRLLPLLAHRMPYLPTFVRRHMLAQYGQHEAHLNRVFVQLVEAQQSDELLVALPRIKAPTLIVWGEYDQIIDVTCADVFDAAISNSSMLILPNVGHIPMVEAPRATALAQAAHMRSAE